MSHIASPGQPLTDQLRRAYADRDLARLGVLLSDDVRWGDDDHPRKCRNRSDVLATFARLMADGVYGEVTELTEGTTGILCRLAVNWPEDNPRHGDRNLYHVYLVGDGRITEIQRYDDRTSAAEAAGLAV